MGFLASKSTIYFSSLVVVLHTACRLHGLLLLLRVLPTSALAAQMAGSALQKPRPALQLAGRTGAGGRTAGSWFLSTQIYLPSHDWFLYRHLRSFRKNVSNLETFSRKIFWFPKW